MNEPRSEFVGKEENIHLQWQVAELLFDMDGTLIDSIAAIEDAWARWADAEEISLGPINTLHGRTADAIASPLLPSERVEAAVQRLDDIEVESIRAIVALPGALDLVRKIPRDRWGVVTSASRRVALTRLKAGGIPTPSRLISGDDVARGKPDPEPYLLAKFMSTDDSRALALEDTVAGLISARGANCLTIGVVGTETAEVLAPYADAVISSLANVQIVQLLDDGIVLKIDALPVSLAKTAE